MGEVRRQKEAETLFEAIHTGHSCYATFHANDSHETVTRLTNPPINIPKLVLPALGVILVQNRNRRTNKRKTMQLAEIDREGNVNVIKQYNPATDKMESVGELKTLDKTLLTFTGMTKKDIEQDLKAKENILRWMVQNNMRNINDIGMIMSRYYTGKLTIPK